MPLPEFDESGDLPAGVYPVTLAEAFARFAGGSAQRWIVAGRLEHVYRLAISTGRVARFAVFGSFVTAKPDPRDVDIVIIMEDGFDIGTASDEVAAVFRHADADTQLGASVFWATRSGAFGGEQALIEYWQTRRDGGQRGILEIVPEGS